MGLNIEGQGVTISFATSGYTADLIALDMPEEKRAVIETTHLGTTTAMTSKPSKLKDVGEISCEFDHNPDIQPLILAAAETVTISYPLLSGQTTPSQRVFTAFAIGEGGSSFKLGERMTVKMSLKVSGDITRVAAT